jgi:hypothetical protein
VLRGRLVVAFFALLVVASGFVTAGSSSPASAITPWSSNYLRFAVFTDGGGDAAQEYSTSEAVSLAERYDVAIALRWTFDDKVDVMRQANSSFRILAYMNGAFSKPQDAPSMPDSWFLKDANGQRITSVKWGNFYMDPANPGWRSWVAQRCSDWTSLSGFDGCVLDDLGAGNMLSGNLSGYPIDPRTGQPMTSDDWIGYVAGLGAQVKDANPRILVTVNGLNNGPRFFGKNVVSKRLLASVDAAIAEGFLRNEYGPLDTFRSETDWKAEVDMLVEAGNMGKSVIVQTKIWNSASYSDISRWRRYAYATFLLGTNGQSYLNFNPIGPGKPPYAHAWDSVDLGTPTGAYAKQDGVYQRSFSNGIAMVNPTKSPVTVTLDQPYKRLNGNTVTSFTLGANQGEILQRTTSSAAPDGVVAFPSPGEVVNGPSVVLSGSATDDVGVTGVWAAVRDRDSLLWLQANGNFGSAYTLLPTNLDAPGAKNTGWSLSVSLPAGNYGVQIKAEDGAGNRDQSPPWVNFSVAPI